MQLINSTSIFFTHLSSSSSMATDNSVNGLTDDLDDGESLNDDTYTNYEDIEARLQQERIDYLRTQKQREMEDAATARQLMQDELLQIEREKLCRVIQDEALARRLQAEEQKTVTQPSCLYDELNDSDSSSDDGASDDELGDVNAGDFDNALYFTGEASAGTHSDEVLARALQQAEEEAAGQRMRQNAQQNDDAYLARIMQNSENINAMRRKYMTETTETVHTVHRRTSVPSQMPPGGAEVSTTPGGATARRSQSESSAHAYRTVSFNTEDPAALQTNGAQGMTTSTAGAQGSATSTTARRRKSATRKSSCKQQ